METYWQMFVRKTPCCSVRNGAKATLERSSQREDDPVAVVWVRGADFLPDREREGSGR